MGFQWDFHGIIIHVNGILIGFSIIKHPAIGVPPFMETPIWVGTEAVW
jgi:hypothetical protein